MSKPKYSLGKITNKHLILEILSYAFNYEQAASLLHKGTKHLRRLITENKVAFINVLGAPLPHSECMSDFKEKVYLSTIMGSKLKNMKLLYRASRDGWNSSDFHLRCDKKGQSLILLQLKNGLCIGGFASA